MSAICFMSLNMYGMIIWGEFIPPWWFNAETPSIHWFYHHRIWGGISPRPPINDLGNDSDDVGHVGPPASLILILVVVVQITIKDFAPSINLGTTCYKFTEVWNNLFLVSQTSPQNIFSGIPREQLVKPQLDANECLPHKYSALHDPPPRFLHPLPNQTTTISPVPPFHFVPETKDSWFLEIEPFELRKYSLRAA